MVPEHAAGRNDDQRPTAITATALTKAYYAGIPGCSARVDALRGIDLVVNPGDALGILGPPGAGKSTLLMCLGGLLSPDSGTVAWFGRTADEAGPPPGIAYASPQPAPYAFMTVREALEYQSTLRAVATRDRAAAVEAALEAVGLGAEASAPVSGLTHGASVRLSLAQALVVRPRILLLDETLSGLASAVRRDIAVIVRQVIDSGVTVVIAADELDAIDAIVSRIAVLLDGRLATIVAPGVLRTSRTLELTIATPAQAGRLLGTRVAEGWERHTLRLPLEGTSAEAILARCQACGIRVETSRVVLTREATNR